jgi:hypothetical protein
MTPWGPATLIDEIKVQQRAGDKRFASCFQLLENERGEAFVRFAYSTGGAARRGPVTLRAQDLDRLRAALAQHPALAQALGPIDEAVGPEGEAVGPEGEA